MPAQRWSVGLCVYLSDGGASVVCVYLGDGGAGGPVVDLAAVRRVELERCPRPTEVDALVDGHRVRARRAELQADVRHLHASTCNQTTSGVAMRSQGQWRVNANRGPGPPYLRETKTHHSQPIESTRHAGNYFVPLSIRPIFIFCCRSYVKLLDY